MCTQMYNINKTEAQAKRSNWSETEYNKTFGMRALTSQVQGTKSTIDKESRCSISKPSIKALP